MAQTQVAQENSSAPTRLRREVGVFSLMFVSLGSIIGSGWLLGALTAAKAAGAASLISWVLAGLIIALLALVHAELGAAYPVAGGTARYPKIVFGGFAGFTAGWAGWLQAVTLAPIEVEAALSYLNHLWTGAYDLVDDSGALTGTGLVIGVVLLAVFTLINALGVRWLAETNSGTVLWKTAVPALTVVVLLVVSFHPGNFTAGGSFAPFGAHGVFAALPLGVVFALQGFEQAVQMSGEARNPQRDISRAVIGAMVIGTLIYIALEIAFIGALDPANLASGWANPIGKGDFGPYAGLATGLGLTWLAVILYIDAFISPAGTGLIYVGTSSRLSYAISNEGFLPKALGKVSKRGVPFNSIILTFVIGLICFLPFPSWQSLVGLITSAAVIMYGFAPITLMALRKADPDRVRPYRLPAASVLAPLSFVAANEIIYWSSWETVSKLLLAIVAGYVLLIFSVLFGRTRRPSLDIRSVAWIAPWFGGLGLISWLGQYGGVKVLPEWVDLAVVAVFSLVVFYLAVALALPKARVALAVEEEMAEANSSVTRGEGEPAQA